VFTRPVVARYDSHFVVDIVEMTDKVLGWPNWLKMGKRRSEREIYDEVVGAGGDALLKDDLKIFD
jgi:hypothetical protein